MVETPTPEGKTERSKSGYYSVFLSFLCRQESIESLWKFKLQLIDTCLRRYDS